MATKIDVTKIRVGDLIGTPGDRKVRTVWGRVARIEKSKTIITFCSPDWATESSRKYGSGEGCYTARRGEKLSVKK